MAKITKVEVKESTYQGKVKKSYLFTLDTGEVGYANDKPWDFKEGDIVDYKKEVKKSAKGEYNLFTFTRGGQETPKTPQNFLPNTPVVPQAKLSPSGGMITPLDVFNAKCAFIRELFPAVLEGLFAGKVDNIRAMAMLDEYFAKGGLMIDEIARDK